MNKLINEIGNRYGRLIVTERAGSNKSGQATWFCQCDCGNKTIVCGSSLRRKETRSCGCLQREIAGNHIREINWIPWDDHFFDKLNFDNAYILGFIVADGTLRATCSAIEFYQKDPDILWRIARTLKFEGEPHRWKESGYTLHLTSDHAIKILTEKYQLPRGKKSDSVQLPPNIPDKFLPHIIRGIFDGDGNISGLEYPQVAFYSNSLYLINDIQAKLATCADMSRGYKFQSKRGTYKIVWSSRSDVISFARYIYGSALDVYGSDLYIRRKKKGFAAILEQYDQLYESYVKEGRSKQGVAKKLNISIDSVGHWVAGCNFEMERELYWNLGFGI